MIIYNETFVVEEAVHQQWLQWMKEEHIPAVIKTGCFESYKILAVLDSPNEGVTYCIQYLTPDINRYQEFVAQYAQQLHIRHHQQFENRYVLFNSLMQEL
ncbi:DUF4286 family protein [Mucilaginibacter sp. Bleaf8]|uniref:DUF4286 family protein n=1 Tax=Mucilaginibacter sp. Bleaf8 TaxID=2834430 RepID=UPI001BD1A0FF|nr:DUF4286 family protein [Mucilaginibacter sp. Bleaf8]MBS7566137.1 DUF4286 family protein [Mucilaginibacter sp. Bleaf8]